MRKFFPGNLIVILAGFILFLHSCSLGSCFEETESLVKATFYDMETGKTLAPDSLTVYGLDMDTSKIYNKTANLLKAKFPLNAADISCIFIIMINGITDTMEFSYSSYPHLLSKECGYTFFYTIDTESHTTNEIDSISITKNTITTYEEENIRIFY
jgi:hypothetical protein